MRSHPDRVAATLADVDDARARQGDGPYAPPGDGARDCRIGLKLLQWRALAACERSARARERLAPFDRAQRPDLWAGTVRDGAARGFAVALEEAIALAGAERGAAGARAAAAHAATPERGAPGGLPPLPVVGKELRKRKDLLVASATARVRFSRKEGLLFVDRTADVNSANCLRFEARADRGTLDGFAPDEAERPRLFSAQFLKPVRYTAGAGAYELVLEGRLGRTAAGFPCRVVLTATEAEPRVRLSLRLENRHRDHRLRARFLGVPLALLEHRCTDVREVVANDAGGFVAFTLVRACGRLLVDGATVEEQDAAQCLGAIEHEFLLGSPG